MHSPDGVKDGSAGAAGSLAPLVMLVVICFNFSSRPIT
jgi:hypothetical protein